MVASLRYFIGVMDAVVGSKPMKYRLLRNSVRVFPL